MSLPGASPYDGDVSWLEIVMRQSWNDLLFLHWRVDAHRLRTLVPAPLEIDLYEDHAWISLIPFTINRTRVRGLPPIPGFTSMREINLRTYVRCEGEAGVWFFSLDASRRLAVAGARMVYHLPYYHAAFDVAGHSDPDGWIDYHGDRHRSPSDFHVRYRGAGPVRTAAPGSLEEFLIERYTLFSVHRGRPYRARVYHEPYPVQDAQIEGLRETTIAATGLPTPMSEPLAHYSRGVRVGIGRIRGPLGALASGRRR
jgi:uncharacterized protein